MKSLRTLVAIGGIASILAMGSPADAAQAAGGAASTDKISAADPAQAKKPKLVSYPAPLILCRPYQTCPP